MCALGKEYHRSHQTMKIQFDLSLHWPSMVGWVCGYKPQVTSAYRRMYSGHGHGTINIAALNALIR